MPQSMPPSLHSLWILFTKDSVYRLWNSPIGQWIYALRPLCLMLIFLFLLACSSGWTAAIPSSLNTTLQEAKNNPQALLRSAVQKELATGYGKRPFLRYRLHKVTEHANNTKEIVETPDGDVACLVAINGHPLSADAWQSERARLLALRAHPELQAHRNRREQEDTRRFEELLRALPDAFQVQFAGILSMPNGPAIRLTFQPNPDYKPKDYETRSLRGMSGELWIDARQKRILYFRAHLFQSVNFGWGILGYLNKGGSVQIQQSQVIPSVWTLTNMRLSLTGRALLVKPLHFDIEESATEYQPVANIFHYPQAVDLLLRNACSAHPQSNQQ